MGWVEVCGSKLREVDRGKECVGTSRLLLLCIKEGGYGEIALCRNYFVDFCKGDDVVEGGGELLRMWTAVA
jgi:hypothetical protein